MNPEQLEKNLKKAIALHQLEKHTKAANIYQKILKAHPKNASALHFFGLLHFHRGQSKEAIELMLASLAIDPNYLDAYLNLGNVFMDVASFEDARKCYEKVLELNHSHIGAATNLGVLLKYLGELAKSEALLTSVCESSPMWGQSYYNLGNTQMAAGKSAEALENYLKAVELNPNISAAYGPIVRVAYILNEPKKAQHALEKWNSLGEDSPVVSHMLAAFSGEGIPSRASDNYITSTFDSYAESFEASLASLDYRGPELLDDALAELNLEQSGRINILDAGCGTGLSQKVLAPLARKLVGMDLSTKMLEKAKQKGGYDRLICASLESGIAEFNQYFDLVVSMDTLIYFGDLQALLAAIKASLKKGGYLIFSTERTAEKGNYFLTQSGRYEHNETYIQEVLSSAGFVEIKLTPTVVRREFNANVEGTVTIAKAG